MSTVFSSMLLQTFCLKTNLDTKYDFAATVCRKICIVVKGCCNIAANFLHKFVADLQQLSAGRLISVIRVGGIWEISRSTGGIGGGVFVLICYTELP